MAAAKDIIPGLELLTSLATVKINQKGLHLMGNKYLVLSEDEVLFNLQEDLAFMSRGRIRTFHMDGVDNTGRKVFMIRRPGMSMSDKVELYMDNVLVSVVRREVTFMTPVFSINDANDCPTLRIKGHATNHFREFQLQTAAKVDIGSINKEFRGLMKEMFAFNDYYVINFPVDLDVRFKLAVIAACIFIDFAYHEKK